MRPQFLGHGRVQGVGHRPVVGEVSQSTVPESGRFERRFTVGWADVDGNAHMANTAFLDRAADTRMLYFAAQGASPARLNEQRIGPVIVRDALVYRKELRFLDEFTVDIELLGRSPDGVRFEISNTFRNSAGEVAAIVTSEGLWFDLEHRRPRPPTPEAIAAQAAMPRSDRFKELPSRPT